MWVFFWWNNIEKCKEKTGSNYDDEKYQISFRLHKQAGVLLLGTAGMIPPLAVEHMETTCTIDEEKEIHPFAFRVHTHSLGKVVSGYRIRDGKWTMLGKRDPMKPQMFYPVNNTEPIKFGDTLAARCTMQSTRKRPTFIG